MTKYRFSLSWSRISVASFIFLVNISSSCNKDSSFHPPHCEYNNMVQIEDTTILHCTTAFLNTVNKLSMTFSYYKEGLKYEVGLYIPPNLINNDSLTMHSYYNQITVASRYSELCCENYPDQVNKEYFILEEDSVNNYIKFQLDTIEKKVTGMFMATYTAGGNDILHIKCDSFECNYDE